MLEQALGRGSVGMRFYFDGQEHKKVESLKDQGCIGTHIPCFRVDCYDFPWDKQDGGGCLETVKSWIKSYHIQ